MNTRNKKIKQEDKKNTKEKCCILNFILSILFIIIIFIPVFNCFINDYKIEFFEKKCLLFIVEGILIFIFSIVFLSLCIFDKKLSKILKEIVVNEKKQPKEYNINSKSLDDERYHMEELINSRFNFLLVIFSATIISLATINNKSILLIVFASSIIISSFFSITIARANLKFNI